MAGMLIPSTTIVTRWFVRSRGTAMGVLSTGGPGSAVAFYPLNAWLIAILGWRMALVAFGCTPREKCQYPRPVVRRPVR